MANSALKKFLMENFILLWCSLNLREIIVPILRQYLEICIFKEKSALKSIEATVNRI